MSGIDAKIYISTVEILASGGNLVNHFKSIAGVVNKDLQYTNVHNLLNLLLIYTYPNTINLQLIPKLARLVLTQAEPIDIEEFANTLPTSVSQEVLVQTANDLLLDTTNQVNALGFTEHTLLSFVQSKTLHLSKYIPIAEISPLFNFSTPEIDQWHKGIMQVFEYYSKYDKSCTLEQFLKLDSLEERFNVLITPLNSNIEQYTNHVLLPLCNYYQDLTPLKYYMFSDLTVGLAKYKKWFTILKSIVHSEFTSDDYREIIEWYIISCYYYAHKEDSLPSIEIINIYDVIYDTLSLFDQPVSVSDLSCAAFIGCNIDIPQQLSTDSFKKVVSTCQNLFPITKLTIVKYLQYNQSVNNKDITKLISTLNHTNYHQLIPAITALQSQFNLDHGLINKLIIERLLASNLFDEVKEYQSKLSSNEFFSLVIDKFWTSFNSATNLNDKIGHLHESKQCLDLGDSLQLNEENHDLIVRLKHLFKAMTNLKNFKIVIDKSKPFTPSQLLSFKDDLIGLITVILQQNPKSYLAFEKLFKIINDLALYFQAEGDFFNKVKIACIESSLIDDNFEYAYTHTKQLFNVNVDELWIIFYQVGKYISPNWTEPNINVLVKQREILSLTLKHISENNKIILDQWEKVNSQIEEYSEQVLNVSESKETSSDDIVENISTDKISNLLVSGLGWAIGAHHR